MGIQNFPAALQPIIQQGFLEREFEQALRSRLGYRAVADREDIRGWHRRDADQDASGIKAERDHAAAAGAIPTSTTG